MNLQAKLHELRAKPEHIRKKYAFWGAASITAIIFVFWLGSFSYNGGPSLGSEFAQSVLKTSTPAQSMIAGVGGFFTDVWELVFGPKKVTYSVIEAVPGK